MDSVSSVNQGHDGPSSRYVSIVEKICGQMGPSIGCGLASWILFLDIIPSFDMVGDFICCSLRHVGKSLTEGASNLGLPLGGIVGVVVGKLG